MLASRVAVRSNVGMKLFLLTLVVMTAFAANSVLNRLALVGAGIGPGEFALIRLGAGALVLAGLVMLRGGRWPGAGRQRSLGVASLLLYALAFSFAYVALDTGAGALLLFGGVQVTMFVGALAAGERVPPRRWLGAGLAMAGLAWMLWPGAGGEGGGAAALLMLAAAFGWGVYSLTGRGVEEPVGATAANFLGAALLAPLVLWGLGALTGGGPAAGFEALAGRVTAAGAALAVLSGAVTSGLGYVLWYRVLPRLSASVAAVAQLSVPVIAALGGLLLLAEPVTLRLALASLLVLGGVALATLTPQRNSGSSGS